MLEQLFWLLGVGVVLCPTALLVGLGAVALRGKPVPERHISRATQLAVISGLFCALSILLLMLAIGRRNVEIEVGDWVAIHAENFHFHLKFVFDRLSVPFVILSFVLIGTIGAFASHYMHRESGYLRFFVLYALFLVGIVVASIAGTIEVLFLGWELVGLSSALLVAYFQERPSPVINGQRVWSVYRVADAAFLVAALMLHHLTGAGDFSKLMGSGPWPEGLAALTPNQALVVGLLLLVAAAGKSALVPFSSWLPRAMEGPTPSSAVFYGALSVHLGTFLLLRVGPLIELSLPLQVAIIALGLTTAAYSALVGRVHADVKTALAFASLTQVGIITAEIGLGFRYLALVHIIGHACLRTLQLLRAPALLDDYRRLENAIGDHLRTEPGFWHNFVPERLRLALYRLSLERGMFDALIDEWIVRPFLLVFRWCDAMERRWTDFLCGRAPGASGPDPTSAWKTAGDELL